MRRKHARAARVFLALVGALALLGCAQVAFAREGIRDGLTSTTSPSAVVSGYSATVEQCVTSSVQSERSATFAAQMVATGTTQRMEIKIELQQRMRGETEYHTIAAPNLGIWRGSEPGVKIDKYVQQVTGLTAPAAYRVFVEFRWLGEKGHVLKRAELHTSHCLQPTLAGQVTQTPPSVTS
ncbi:MAG TPA: hypothetical protein VGP18_01200 [Solirubrobacteraceae bacterium]|jgi:outer membrane lipoprotein-sorting protein|nr:hypothetical protein [Solirubrobacteraceae bacterium]